MAYDRNKIQKQLLANVEADEHITTFEDAAATVEPSRKTLYDWGFDKLDNISEAISNNVVFFIELFLILVPLLSLLFIESCSDENPYWYGSATATIISVDKHDVVGSDIQTTLVFEDGQVVSEWDVYGQVGDVLYFSRVKMRTSDSSIVYIPYDCKVKNITGGRSISWR